MDITFSHKLSRIRVWVGALIDQLLTGPHLVSYMGIFGVFLILGTVAGISIGKIPQNAIIQQIGSPLPPNSTIQQNILIIGVDDLGNKNPRLQSVWLLLYLPGNHHINFVSIYPSSLDNSLIEPSLVESYFKLDSEGMPDSLFFKILRAEDIWWSNYALIDEIGLIHIIDMFGGLQLNGYHLTGSLALDALPVPWENPSTAIRVQTSLIAGLCERVNHPPPDTYLAPILEIIPQHVQTDMDTDAINRVWHELMINSVNLVCEFPLLETINQ